MYGHSPSISHPCSLVTIPQRVGELRLGWSPSHELGSFHFVAEELGGDGISNPARDGRKENQTNNKQSNSRTHVDFFEYIEMSCDDNTGSSVIRSDNITSIHDLHHIIMLWSPHIAPHMEDTFSTQNTHIKHYHSSAHSVHTVLHCVLIWWL